MEGKEEEVVELPTTENLRLELSDCWNIDQFKVIFESNSSATDVDICIHESFSLEISNDQAIHFFQLLVSTLPKLRRLELFPGVGGYNAVPIEALGVAIGHAHNLQSLYLYHIELSGEGGNFISLAENLQRHSSLKEFCIIDCQITENEISNEHAFEPILRALGTISTLQVVALWASEDDSLGRLSNGSLATLCQSTSIQRLMLLKFNLQDQDIGQMFDALSTNQSMKRIYMSCSLKEQGSNRLVKMLQSNSTMQKLKLDLDSLDKPKCLLKVAEALETNTSLNYLKLCGGTINTEIEQAFLQMLEKKNFSLETLLLPSVGSDLTAQMDFYLKVNRSGFRHIIREGTAHRSKWVEALISTNDDLDTSFYFLSMNPSLCVL